MSIEKEGLVVLVAIPCLISDRSEGLERLARSWLCIVSSSCWIFGSRCGRVRLEGLPPSIEDCLRAEPPRLPSTCLDNGALRTAYLIIDDFMLGPRDLRGRINFADITIGALCLWRLLRRKAPDFWGRVPFGIPAVHAVKWGISIQEQPSAPQGLVSGVAAITFVEWQGRIYRGCCLRSRYKVPAAETQHFLVR
jgi:hypothetical protein